MIFSIVRRGRRSAPAPRRLAAPLVLALVAGGLLASGTSAQAGAVDDPLPPPPVTGSAIDVANSEAAYTPIAPCRIADTRSGGGKLNGTNRSFYVSGTVQFVPQGGKSGGCGIPHSATSVAISITTVEATNNGWLVAFPNGSSIPTATSMNFSGDRKSTTSLIVKLGSGTGKRLNLRNYEANTHVIIDVTGYFAEQMTGMVDPTGALYQKTARVVSSSRVQAGIYRVTFDRDVTYCLPVATGYYGPGVSANAYAYNGNIITIYSWRDVGSGPVPYDYYVYFGVIC